MALSLALGAWSDLAGFCTGFSGDAGLAGLVFGACGWAHPTLGKIPNVDVNATSKLDESSRETNRERGGGLGDENKWRLWVAHRRAGLKVTTTGFSSGRPGHPGSSGKIRPSAWIFGALGRPWRLSLRPPASISGSFVFGEFTSAAKTAWEVGFKTTTKRSGCLRSLTDRRCVGNGMRVYAPTERGYTLRSMVGSCSLG